MKYELNRLFNEFFNENPEGVITICYPNPLWEGNKYGVSFGKDTYKNQNKLQFKKEGLFIRQTLGYSLITGKHLYIPYNQIQSILFEEQMRDVE